MKLIIIFAAIWVAAESRAANTCAGEWSEWSEWRSAYHDSTGQSWPAERGVLDRGGQNRAKMMKVKADNAARRQTCKEHGSCVNKASESSYQCFGGKINGVLDCLNIDQVAFMNFADLGSPGAEGNDIWGWTDTINNKEYAIMGLTTGTSFVDITDPAIPKFIGFMASNQNRASTWRDMKVIGNFVYVGSEANLHGIQYYDMTGLETHPEGTAIAQTGRISGTGSCHNIVVSESSKTVIGVGCTACDGGLQMYDVGDQTGEPVLSGCFNADGYTHDAQCVSYSGPDSAYTGREICFAFNEDTLTIVDITDKAAPTQISRTAYSGVQYSHQGWVTEDQTLLLLDDELDEDTATDKRQRTYIWDIRSLTNPVLRNTYYSTVNSIDHNQYIIGSYTYQSNYQTGLRILSIDQANYELNEVAFFDTYAGTNNAAFNGAWSVYPYFASGNIVISTIEDGMYIVRPTSLAKSESKEERTRYRKLLKGDAHVCPGLSEIERR